MITLIIMVLAALLGVWLLARTVCIQTRFITQTRSWIQRIFLRRTRRGWENIAMNEATSGEGELADNEKDAMLRELLDLDHNADDDDVRQRFGEYGEDDKAENAKRTDRRKEACTALGLDDDADADTFHRAVLSVPSWLEDLRKEAANARKATAKALLDLAINDGRVVASQRAIYETAFNADYPGTVKRLAGEDKKLNTDRLDMSKRKGVTSNTQELSSQVDDFMTEQMSKGIDHRTAWNTAKKDKRFAEYFALQTKQPQLASND